jgi:hypothetical protein
MPLPVIPVVILLSSLAAAGSAKGVGGAHKMARAKRMAETARLGHDRMVCRLERKRTSVVNAAEEYARYLLHIKDTTFRRTIEVLEAIGGGHEEKIYETLEDIGISRLEINEYRQNMVYVQSVLEGGFTALAAGSAAGPAATTGAVFFGATSSTGTAIGSLSGVAAKNAILAWFGGGAVASGGGGIAVGTAVLGGIAVAPAVAVAGFVLSRHGEKALTAARKYVAEVNIATEELRTVISFLGGVLSQIAERSGLLDRLNRRAENFLSNINAADFDRENDEHMRHLQGLLQIVAALSEIIQAPIITPDGDSIDESGVKIVARYKKLI